MHILFKPDTLEIQCILYDCHELTAAFHRERGGHIEIPDRIPHDELRIALVDGKPTVHRVQGDALEPIAAVDVMPILAPAALTVGVEAVIEGVPEGVAVSVDGAQQGVMDAAGRLEITPQVAGFYRLVFSGAGWITKEIKLEARPR